MGLFDAVALPRVPHSKIDFSFDNKFTGNMGNIYPVLCKEALPGDHWRCRATIFVRFLALLAPIMHKVNVKWELFFVPNRLLWTNFPTFITGGEDGVSAPAFPTFRIGDVNNSGLAGALADGSLLDYLGFPTLSQGEVYNVAYDNDQFGALPVKAYNKVFDDWYRNEITPSVLPADFLADGLMAPADCFEMFKLRQCNWEKDLYTSCLPTTQRGTEVVIPIASTITASTTGDGGVNHAFFRKASTGAADGGGAVFANAAPNSVTSGSAGGQTIYYDPNGTLVASNSSLTINGLRASITLQQFKEINMRGGARYIEYIKNFFDVDSKDARLQRTELIYSSRSPVTVSEVLTTSTSTVAATPPPGTLAGHGISVDSSDIADYFVEEHGFMLGMFRIVPRTAYQNGIPYEFTRQIYTDFYNPVFANLGEQSIRQFSIYYSMSDAAGHATTGNVFGYNSRFVEYKYANDQVHGQFKKTLAFWHLGRQFAPGAAPLLNTAFVTCSPRADIFAVTTDVNHIVCEMFWDISVLRPMPYFGIPAGLFPGYSS